MPSAFGPVALITGVTGQDGTYLTELLLAEGYAVHGVVKPRDDAPRPGSEVELHECDLADADGLAAVIRSVAPDEVYNLAGQSSVARSWEDPIGTATTTGLAVMAIAQACWELQLAGGQPVRLVQASSAEIFGSAIEVPQTENTRVAPVSPYGVAKAFGHLTIGTYRARGLHASSVILYNHESPLRPETFVTRKITASVARIARGLQSELSLGNLDAARDWGWAPDYVRALHLAGTHPEPGDYVIGTGELHTVRQFVAAAFAEVGIGDWEHLVSTDSRFARPVDPPTQLADPSRAREVLGWAPAVSFDELVARMVRHDLDLIG